MSSCLAPDRRPPEVRLRLPTGWLSVPEGRHELGRSPGCDIVLEGDRVSRLHARLVVDDDGAAIEDLASSNGVYVNHERLTGGARRLSEGDVVRLGELEILVSFEAGPVGESSGPILVRSARSMNPHHHAAPTSPGIPVSLDLLGSVAERIIAAGDPQRAEGMLQNPLERMLASARAGEGIDPQAHDRAVHLALSLARALKSVDWIHWTLDVLSVLAVLPTDMQLTELEGAVAEVDQIDARRLTQYAEVVRAMPTSMEKLKVMQRLDNLRPMAHGARSSR